MSIQKYGSQGSRLRHVRKHILRLTQDELSAKLGVTRSLVPMMEKDKQGISKATAEKLRAHFGVNMVWLLTGEGEALEAPEKPALEDQNVIKESSASCNMSMESSQLFTDPAVFRDLKGKGRFGYLSLAGTKLRMHAARDNAIAGSRLYQIIEDDKLWYVAGEPIGWELEVLREYYEFGLDRSLPEWMECLRLIRWQRRLLIAGATEDHEEERGVQSA